MATLPNMGLETSIIGTTLDPRWSANHESNWKQIDNHDHITIGKKIVSEAIDIDDDLSMQGNNLIDIRSIIFQNLVSDPSNLTDLCCPYFKNGNLWVNNGAGGHVQITNGAGLNVSTGTANLFTPLHINTSTTILNTDDYTYIEVETTSALNLFLPSASTVAGNRFYYIKDVTGLSGTNAITLVPTGGNEIDQSTSNYQLKRNFGSWLVVSDGVSNWYVSQFSNKEINDGTWNSTGNPMVIDSKANSFTLKNDATASAFTMSAFGSGFTFNADAVFNNNITLGSASADSLNVNATSFFHNNVTLGASNADALSINATTTFYCDFVEFGVDDVLFNGNVTVGNSSSDDLIVNAEVSILNNSTIGSSNADALTVNSTSTFNGNITCGNLTINSDTAIGNSAADGLTVTATSVFASPVAFNGSVFNLNASSGGISTVFTNSGTARITKRILRSTSNNFSAGPAAYDVVSSNAVGVATFTFDNTGVIDGDILTIGNLSASAMTGDVSINGGTTAVYGRVGGAWYKLGN